MPLTTDDNLGSRKRDKAGKKPDPSERKRKKGLKYKDESDDRKLKKHKKKHDKQSHVNITDEADEEDVWIEKNIDGETPLAQNIPTAESLKLTSRAYVTDEDPPPPLDQPTESRLKRDDWMLGDTNITMPASNEPLKTTRWRDRPSQSTGGEGGNDFFASLGIERNRKEASERPDPDKLVISSREINPHFREGKTLDEYVAPKSRPATPGGPGSQWRMMKLRRVYETAEEENHPVEEVALDKFGSMELFEAAKEERRILDEREGRRSSRGRDDRRDRSKNREGNQTVEQRFMFSEVGSSALLGRSSSFRKPGGQDYSGPSTPVGRGSVPPTNRRLDSLRLPSEASSPATANSVLTPIPTVMTPPIGLPSSKFSALPTEDLNKLQAKVLKAKLMGSADADRLEQEYETEVAKARSGGVSNNEKVRVEVLPSMDARGRLYDVGQGKEDVQVLPGKQKRKEKVEMYDPKTGKIVRYNADDDSTTLGDMLRQEKLSAGMADQKNLDAQLANAIMSDGKFQAGLEYMDENAESLGRKKMRSDAMKRQFAINDYARTKRVLDSCPHCYGEDDSPPKVPVIAMATRCYLACTTHEELVDGHCHIVSIQHHLSTLEGDDDLWDEIRNFMKCLMRMYAEEDKGVIFFETVVSLRWQKHTYIECVPVPWNVYEDLPAYFKESILQSETEWSQHKKLIDFSARPGGFRRAMVPNLPYFMVQWDYKGEKGYGHVIEGTGDAAAGGEASGAIDEGEKGGGEFPRYFAAEIIGNQLDLEPRRWRRPRRVDFRLNKERVSAFRAKYEKYDWTEMITRG